MTTEQINSEEQLGAQMSFLDHIDELRRRLIRSVIFVTLAFVFCYFFSNRIFDFLAVPVNEALAEARQRAIDVESLEGNKEISTLSSLQEGDAINYVFDKTTKLGISLIAPGATVEARVAKDADGKLALFTDEPLLASNVVIPKGIKLPVNFEIQETTTPTIGERLTVTSLPESFTLYVTVSLYAAIAVSIPFLLWQIWGFIAPALYRHERGYVTPFIGLSTISFVVGAAFAYYVLFPPAMSYLLGLGKDFSLLLRASDYFDFITLIMLAMGIIFQMPAITYVLARIGLINAGFLVRGWRIAIVVILIVAAVASPTGDIPNMMLFATPMMVLYVISIFIAWFFGRKRVVVEIE